MCALLCFVLAVLASPFKSNIRLEAENEALRQHARERRAPARRVVPGARLPPPERGRRGALRRRRVRAVVWPATAQRALRPPGRGRAPQLEREAGARPSGLPRRGDDDLPLHRNFSTYLARTATHHAGPESRRRIPDELLLPLGDGRPAPSRF